MSLLAAATVCITIGSFQFCSDEEPKIITDNTIYLTEVNENNATSVYCDRVGGIEEVRKYYRKKNYVKVDCETDEEVIEAGLDKRSSLDSVQQAVFFSILTGKKPVVVIYDTDGKEGRFEYRIRKVCEELDVEYRSIRVAGNR